MEPIRRRPEPIYEEIEPKYDWTLVNGSDVLLVDLPGFKKEELKVQVDNLGKVMVSGERQVNENKRSRFRQIFEAPQDSDISKISGRFDGDLLFIYIPRKIAQTSTTEPNAKEEEKGKEDQKMKLPENIKKEEEQKVTQEIKEEESKKEPERVTSEERPNCQEEKITNEERQPKSGKIQSGEIAKEGTVSSKKKDDDEEEGEAVREEVRHDDDGNEVRKEKREVKKEKKRRTKAQEKERNVEKAKRNLSGHDTDEKRELRDEVLRGRKDQLHGLMEDAVQEIKKNKSILIAAVLSFSLGFYLSRKFRSNDE